MILAATVLWFCRPLFVEDALQYTLAAPCRQANPVLCEQPYKPLSLRASASLRLSASKSVFKQPVRVA